MITTTEPKIVAHAPWLRAPEWNGGHHDDSRGEDHASMMTLSGYRADGIEVQVSRLTSELGMVTWSVATTAPVHGVTAHYSGKDPEGAQAVATQLIRDAR
jgi:hypothetical protein